MRPQRERGAFGAPRLSRQPANPGEKAVPVVTDDARHPAIQRFPKIRIRGISSLWQRHGKLWRYSRSRTITIELLACIALGAGRTPAGVHAPQGDISSSVTSVRKGDGANLGGFEGADAHCQALAKAAGSSKANWKAYLSTTAPGGEAGTDARDRIGKGPWQNSKNQVIVSTLMGRFAQREKAVPRRPF